MSNKPYEYMDKQERDKIRDHESFQRWQAEQDRLRRKDAGQLTPEEKKRASLQRHAELKWQAKTERAAEVAAYRKRVDDIARKKQVKRAAKAKEDYLIRVANEKIEEANKQKCLVFDLDKEIAALEAIPDLFETEDEEFARYH